MSYYLSSWLQEKSVNESEAFLYERLSGRTNLPISIADLEQHLRIDDPIEQSSYLTMLINAAVFYAEDFMGVSIINQKWRTYRDNFYAGAFELRKAYFVSLESIQYLKNGVYTAVDPTIYYISKKQYYNQLMTNINQQWPYLDVDPIDNAIKIEFTAGLGAAEANIPADLQMALLNYVAFMYENRGNNDIAGMTSSGFGKENSGLNAIPNICRDVFLKYKVPDVYGGFEYTIY
jgi:uncharacterized phiE125 gp8 family phage protein